MPELPEVETTVRGINTYAKGLSIKDVWTNYKSSFHKSKDNIKNPKFFSSFKKAVIGQKIISAKRRAKNILIELSNDTIVLIHMKMTGHLLYGKFKLAESDWVPEDQSGPLGDPFNKFIRFVLTLSNGNHLALSDMRRFAKITLFDGKNIHETSHLEEIGPEPLDTNFTFEKFKERVLIRPKGKIKQVLMDQSVIAGIGNIYSDEILWRANVHPESWPTKIPAKEFEAMYEAMKATLKKGIDFGGDSMSDYRNILGERGRFQEQHNAYRLTGKPCKKKGCGGVIERKIIGGRSGHFCNTHQKLFC